MKSVLIIVMIVFLSACELSHEQPKPKRIYDNNLLFGEYKGTFFECGKYQCYQKDTIFKVVNRDGKAILIFGNIEHEIAFYNNTATVVSANLSWDYTHTNSRYDIQGRYRNDSLQLGLSQYLLSPDMYLNELSGKKQ